MEHSVKTIPGTWYTITATAPATVIEFIQGEIATLATLKKSGTDFFRPSTTQVTINTEGKFTVLPTKAPGAPFPGTGGNVQFTDEQAAQLQTLAANSANLTAHTENTEIHVTAAERESWNRTSGNFKVVTEWSEARPIILEDRTAYLPLLATNELSNLWLEPPTPMPETFVATLEFSSGETATRYRGTGITWSGDDVVNGVFVPQANTRYSCVFYYIGDSFCGEVSAERYLSTHVSDTTKHITEDERTKWNAAAENAGGSSEVMSEKWLVQVQMPCFTFIYADDVMTDNSTYRIEAFHTLTDATSADPMRAVLTSLIGSITAQQAKSIVSGYVSDPVTPLLIPLY